MSDVSETGGGKARKRSSSKAAGRPAAKVKATIHLSLDASQRLTVHAAMLGLDRSELVENLIQTHLRRFVISDRGGPDEEPGQDAA